LYVHTDPEEKHETTFSEAQKEDITTREIEIITEMNVANINVDPEIPQRATNTAQYSHTWVQFTTQAC